MLRLKVAEYFDSVVSCVDLFTESKLQENVSEEEERMLNERRSHQIESIKQLEAACYLQINNTQNKIDEDLSAVFVQYCFTHEYAGLLYLIKTKRYINMDEKRLIQNILNWDKLSWQDQLSTYIRDRNGVEPEYKVRLGVNLASMVRDQNYLPVIELDWMQDSHGIDELESTYYEANILNAEFVKTMRIREYHLHDATGAYSTEFKSPNSFMNENPQIDKLYLHLYDNGYNISQEYLEYLKLTKNNPRIEVIATYSRHMTADESILEDPDRLRALQQLRGCANVNIEGVTIRNWMHVDSITLECTHPVMLADVKLNGLECIKSLVMSWSDIDMGKHSVDLAILSLNYLRLISRPKITWSFLDPVRASLESLRIEAYTPAPLSWKIFDKMTNLRDLGISEQTSITGQLELDSQNQLFASLTNLKGLSLSMKGDRLFTTKWSCHLPLLESLSINWDGNRASRVKCRVSFNLPKLTSLSFKVYRESGNSDFSSIVANFRQVKHLILESDMTSLLNKGWFKDFKSVERLEVSHLTGGVLDESSFTGLTSLKYLTLRSDHNELRLTRGALRSLVNLKTFDFSMASIDDFKDQDMFDNLYSLERISICVKSSDSNMEKFIYFKNLKRFILVNSNTRLFCLK